MEATRNAGSVNELRDKTAQVKRDLQELGSTAKIVAQEKWEEIRHGAVEIEKGVEEGIRQHPIRSVAIAAGVGLVVGLLLRRR